MKKNGFTLVELLGVIVVLAIIVLLAVTAVVPIVNKAKKGALVDEALAYVKAAKQAYTVDNENNSKTVCYEISYLNEKYINKDATGYSGAIIINGSINNIMTSLSDGNLYLYNNGSSKIKAADVSKTMPTGFVSSCGSFNPVLSNEVNTNSLVYKLIMANGKSTLKANLNDISTRSASVNFAEVANTAAKSGMFTAADDDGASYYYRGIINNNWVSFAGFYWRIVRINGDGSIKLIYSGTAASDHTGDNASIITSSFGDKTSHSTTTLDVTGLTSTNITTNYTNGRYSNTHIGYMYNPAMILNTYPTYNLNSSKKLNTFPTFTYIDNTKEYYLFKNFNLNSDCFKGDDTDETGTCTLKCASLGDDCIKTNWNTYATTTGNYSTSATGATSTEYVYTSNYKYTCWGYGVTVTRSNSNSTTSVYVSCPLVSEIVGTINNQATKAKVRFNGLFSPSEEAAYTNAQNSKIKNELDTWYETNIYNKKDASNKYYEDYLIDEIFCNDRSTIRENQTFPLNGSEPYFYAPYTRISTNREPSLRCPNKGRDGFTLTTSARISAVKASGKGNKKLKYPVGLITADEVAYAGSMYNTTNTVESMYLTTGSKYWTSSPFYYSTYYGYANGFYVGTDGILAGNGTHGSMGVRPVINLSPDVLFNSGNGTESSPYTVKLQ